MQQYLNERPDAPDREVIESRIANYLQRKDQETARVNALPPPVTAPTPAPVVTPAPGHRFVAGWIVSAIGAGLLVAALGTGVTAHLTYNDVVTKCGGTLCDGSNQDLRNEVGFGRALTISTDTLLAVGGATLITGVVLFIVEARRKH